MAEDVREQQKFSVERSWSSKDERDKQNYYNDALKDREHDLINAREQLQMLRSEGHDSLAVVGSLVALAYQLNEAAARRAQMQNDEVPESVEKIREEFHDALKIEKQFSDDTEFVSPDEVQRLSEERKRYSVYSDQPTKLRKLMDQNGTKLRSLIGIAYAGTEVMTEGASDENELQMR